MCVLLYKKKCKTPRDPSVNSSLVLARRSNGDPEKIVASHGVTESIAKPGMAIDSTVSVRGREGCVYEKWERVLG